MVRGIQTDKIETVRLIIIHATYSESSYFFLLGDICLITVDQPLWKIFFINFLSFFSVLFFEQGYLCNYVG